MSWEFSYVHWAFLAVWGGGGGHLEYGNPYKYGRSVESDPGDKGKVAPLPFVFLFKKDSLPSCIKKSFTYPCFDVLWKNTITQKASMSPLNSVLSSNNAVRACV